MAFGLALAVVPGAVRRARRGDATMLLVWIGGTLAALFEPILDTLMHLWFAPDVPGPPMMRVFDLRIPLFVPPAYAFFVGITGYFAYLRLRKAAAPRDVITLWLVLVLVLVLVDAALEYPAVLSDIYVFYGEQPWEVAGLPLVVAVINATAMLVVGVRHRGAGPSIASA